MATAVQSPLMYFGIKLSDNIARTAEGYLICCNAVIARTGFQTYKGKELPQRKLEILGIKLEPNDEIEVYRSPSEVFAPAAIASFEGKPITDNHPPGQEFVDPDNIAELQKGHLQHVHKGDEALPSGDLPLLADVLVTHSDLISKIEAGERELSGGYDYDLAMQNGRLCQVNIQGNHVAVVPKGRAGGEARIVDAAPEDLKPKAKEKRTMRTPKELMQFVIGLGIKAMAALDDTKPEELALATRAFDAEPDDKDDKKGKEGEKADDAAGEDRAPANLHKALDSWFKARKAKGKGKAKADDKRADDSKADDADLDELKAKLGEYLDEEGEEGEHADDTKHAADCEDKDCTGDCMKGKDADDDDDDKKDDKDDKKADDKGRGKDAAPIIEPLLSPEDREDRGGARGIDAAAIAYGQAEVLNMLRPFIARTKDRKLFRAFDAISENVTARAAKAGKGSYAAFVAASGKRDEDGIARARDAMTEVTDEKKLNKVADDAYAARHRKNPATVH